MSFFAGIFQTPQGKTIDPSHPGIETALKINSGACVWRASGQGILAHSQSLITPEDEWERQPVVFESGRKVLVFDGRLDNRDDLIRSLGLRAERRTLPDSALVAAAIERWGDDACRRLIGDFAFACWDVVHRQLFLTCDPIGGRIILYHANEQRIVFGTTVESILAFPGVSREVDLQCIAHLLLDTVPPLGITAFRDVKQLPAGHNLLWSAERMRVRQHWSPDFTTRIRYQRDQEYVDHARELLDEAVRCRLRAIGPIACQLSGGFDSAGVTATAAKLYAPSPVFSFTAVPQTSAPLCPTGGRIFVDEWKHARAVADMHPNLNAYAAPATPPAYTDPRLLFHLRGMPIRNFLNVAWFGRANEMARQLGARVLLVGTAGNVTLSWSGLNGVADLAQEGRLWALRREVLGLSRQGVQDPWHTIRRNVLPALIGPRLRNVLKRGKSQGPRWKATSAIRAEFSLAVDAEAIAADNTGAIPGLSQSDSARLHLFERMWRKVGSSLLRPFFGLEHRDPLADIRLAEFCIALPPDQYLLDGVTRRLARRVLADRLPASLLKENRIGRQNPEWFFRLTHAREQMRATVDRLQRSPLTSYALDLRRMKAILEDWPADATDAQPKYGALVSVLARGANIGEFLEWVEGGCVPPSKAAADPILLAS